MVRNRARDRVSVVLMLMLGWCATQSADAAGALIMPTHTSTEVY